VKDRKVVGERMKAHVAAQDTTPLLIFPEGTCVNNEYCVMFKRGAFDLDATVCPIAIKYNKIFVDAFWNSRRQSFTAHLVRLVAPCPALQSPLKKLSSNNCSRVSALQFVHVTVCMMTCPGISYDRHTHNLHNCMQHCIPPQLGALQVIRDHKLVLCLQLKLMTSWAVVCDVYFLEPQTKGPDETSQQFAERVQKLIAQRANLHIAPWDGYLKYYNLGDKVSCSSAHFVSARKVWMSSCSHTSGICQQTLLRK